jgi:CotS family spore coat protein
MEEWMIQPWGDVEGAVPTVPPELEAMAREVILEYDMTVSDMQLITTKPDKGGAIWKIQTNHGPRSLKVLHRTPARSLFSVGAQEYLVAKGARVPALIPSKSGELSVLRGGKLWIVTDWIEPLTPATKIDLAGAEQLCFGLGEFHKWSQGYVPPKGAEHASRLYRYPMTYHKILTKLDWFRQIATLYSDLPASQKLLSLIPKYEQQAKNALYTLEQSPYQELIQRGETAWGLAHQDYGWSNGQIGPDGQIWIIDLDGVAYDLPIRDLRKLITSTMEDMGRWDLTWIRGMIDAYNRANPIEPELMQVFLIDMAMPNEFYKHIKEVVYSPELFLTAETEALLDRMEATDATKWPALQELGVQILDAPADWVPTLKLHKAKASGITIDRPLPEAAPAPAAALPVTPDSLPVFDRLFTGMPSTPFSDWIESIRQKILEQQGRMQSQRSSIDERQRPKSSDYSSSNVYMKANAILENLMQNLQMQPLPVPGQLSPYTEQLIDRIIERRKERRSQ